MQVLNHDMASLVRRMRRFKKEIIKSVSANLSELSEHDEKRFGSYISAIKYYKAWMTSQPVLDLPETSPMTIEIDEIVDAVDMENDDLALIVNLFQLIESEMVNSQSARRSTGMVSHDSLRFDSYIEKIEKFMTDFLSKTNPIDLPESAPMAAVTGHGNRGI